MGAQSRGRRTATSKELRAIESEGMALRSQNPSAALERFRAVLAQDPNRAASHKAAGRLLMKVRRYEEARPHWERFSRIVTDDPEPHIQLARIHRNARRDLEAAVCVRKALELSPHHAAARELKAGIDERRGEEFGLIPPTDRSAVHRLVHRVFRAFGLWSRKQSDGVRPAHVARRLRIARLTARAQVQAGKGDKAGLLVTLETLIGMVGFTPELVDFMGGYRKLLEGDPPPWLAAALSLDASAADQLALRVRKAGVVGDLANVAMTLEALVSLEGPTERAVALVHDHRGAVESHGSPRLATILQLSGPRLRPSPSIDPGTKRLLDDLAMASEGGEIQAITVCLEALSLLAASDDHARRAVERHSAQALERLATQRTDLPPGALTSIETRLAAIYERQAWVLQALARQREEGGDARGGLGLYEGLSDSAERAAPALFHAATLAAALEEWEAALEFATRAIRLAPDDRRIVGGTANLFMELGRPAQAEHCWRLADERGPAKMWIRAGLMRALEAAEDLQALASEAAHTLQDVSPFADLEPADQNYLVDMVRRLVQAQSRSRPALGLAQLAERLSATEPPSPLREWVRASLALAKPDYREALALLDAGLVQGTPPDGVALDLRAERALIYQRYHLYGEALDELAKVPAEILVSNSHYARRLESLTTVAELCAAAPQPLRYPECLIDVLLQEAAGRAATYAPRPRHVIMVSGSLGQGGGERQTITVVRRMLEDRRTGKLSLLVRSTHFRDSDDFFVHAVSQLPVDLEVYGKDWEARTDLAQALPEFADRPRLLAALDLMPHNAREEISRLCRLILDRRPQAVHIWQDIPNAALACALIGVPRFFIHRGSLAPDYWEQNELQTEVHFRPMRHAYRRLLERPDFLILNNSISGCRTDQEWLAWPDPAPFQVVYNAVDFGQLGPNSGRNAALRRELGLEETAPLIGGSFRIVSVKRPLYWIEAARRIRETIPGAQFLIIGDGDMSSEVAEYAREHGFADALHLPGRVSNVGDWYRAMDLMLMTSEREGIPNAIIEAQHFGVPVVATAVGGIHEAIDEGQTGFVVNGDDGAEPYAERVLAVLSDSAWHDASRTKAPAFVHEKFSLDHVLDQLFACYGMGADIERAATEPGRTG